MTRVKDSNARPPQAIRAELVARLRKRAPEIEKAICARVRALSESVDEDPAYLRGLRSAVSEGMKFCLMCIERGGESPVPIPVGPAIAQAQRAARHGVRLDTLLRRYVAGNKLLEEFIVEEADDVPGGTLRQILRDQGPQVDRIIEVVSVEYMQELKRIKGSSAQKRAERLQRLLSDDGFDDSLSDFDYDFNLWHLGFVMTGEKAEAASSALAVRFGCRSLHVPLDTGIVWAWLGSSQKPVMADVERTLLENIPTGVSLVVGEPRLGLDGWRLTHHEAEMGWQVMQHRPQKFLRASEVTLLASVLRDDTIARSLLETYLAPLDEYDGLSQDLRKTLRAYFSSEGNAAAAAMSLGVTRHTVQRRIRTVEKALGKLLHTCHAELQVALQLEELDSRLADLHKSI